MVPTSSSATWFVLLYFRKAHCSAWVLPGSSKVKPLAKIRLAPSSTRMAPTRKLVHEKQMSNGTGHADTAGFLQGPPASTQSVANKIVAVDMVKYSHARKISPDRLPRNSEDQDSETRFVITLLSVPSAIVNIQRL
ncbi:MAG: hypothetical protein Q9188_001700 [Gyalolechia gomerana]